MRVIEVFNIAGSSAIGAIRLHAALTACDATLLNCPRLPALFSAANLGFSFDAESAEIEYNGQTIHLSQSQKESLALAANHPSSILLESWITNFPTPPGTMIDQLIRAFQKSGRCEISEKTKASTINLVMKFGDQLSGLLNCLLAGPHQVDSPVDNFRKAFADSQSCELPDDATEREVLIDELFRTEVDPKLLECLFPSGTTESSEEKISSAFLGHLRLKSVETTRDGSCFFGSIAYQLHYPQLLGDKPYVSLSADEQAEIRQQLRASAIIGSPMDIKEALKGAFANVDDYEKHLSNPTTYAEEHLISGLAERLQIKIAVITSSLTEPKVYGSSEDNDVVYMVRYYAGSQHYKALVPLGFNPMQTPKGLWTLKGMYEKFKTGPSGSARSKTLRESK